MPFPETQGLNAQPKSQTHIYRENFSEGQEISPFSRKKKNFAFVFGRIDS